MLMGGHWYGVLGTAPGTGTGSQTIEARHSDWETLAKSKNRSDMFEIWPVMENIYDTWNDTFAWGAEVSFTNDPHHFNETLLNGGGLKSVGRSTAVDFWRQRNQGDGHGNYVKIARRTGSLDLGLGAHTLFYVVQAHKVGETMPADAKVSPEDAAVIVDLLLAEGAALEKLLEKSGIVSGEKRSDAWQVNHALLTSFFVHHCVVITGHLPSEYWPKYRRSNSEPRPVSLCTCAEFGQHAECEHVVFCASHDRWRRRTNACGHPSNEDTWPKAKAWPDSMSSGGNEHVVSTL